MSTETESQYDDKGIRICESVEGLNGTFSDASVGPIRWMRDAGFERILANMEAGRVAKLLKARPYRAYKGDVADGMLIALTSQDPQIHGGGWRLSVSHRNKENLADRYATWDELKVARYRLIPKGVCMAMVMPDGREDYIDVMPFCLQMIQIDAVWVERGK